MDDVAVNKRRYFPGLLSSSYEHPEDKKALDAARNLPGFDKLVQGLLSMGFEPAQYAINVGNNIRVTPLQYPKLYKLFRYAVEALDVPEPELFVTNNRMINAFTSGAKKPWIVLHTGLFEIMTEEEILWVISHELGHIKSGHVLYNFVARYSLQFALSQLSRIPVFGELIQGMATEALYLALLQWSRMSEFTADRAAHLVSGDIKVGVSALMKLSGAYGVNEAPNLDEFMKQATEFKQLDSSLLGKAAMLLGGTLLADHPYTVVRANHLQQWNESPTYERITMGQDLRGASTTSVSEIATSNVIGGELRQGTLKCPKCGDLYHESDMYCLNCGARVSQSYFGNAVSVIQPTRKTNSLPNKVNGYKQSQLIGGLGTTTNTQLNPNETIFFELEANTGVGLCFTGSRLVIVRAGLIATGSFNGSQINTIEYTNIEGHEFVQVQKGGQKRYFFYMKSPSFDHAKLFSNAEQNLQAPDLNKLFPQVIEFLDQQRMLKLQEFLDSVNLNRLTFPKQMDVKDVLSEIERLADLRQKGSLSEEEFNVLKTKLLS